MALIKGGDAPAPTSKIGRYLGSVGKDDEGAGKRGSCLHSNHSLDQPSSRSVAKKSETSLPKSFIEPMKARLVESPPKGNWIYEIKFDGFRAMALKDDGGVRLLSRNEKDFGSKFPEVLDSIAKIRAHDAIIDGEIVALDSEGRSSFQLLQAHALGAARPSIFFYAFDLLQLNGKDFAPTCNQPEGTT